MHNHYYFLRQLSVRLEKLLQGSTAVSCFSQEKDELVIEFGKPGKSILLKCALRPEIQCLSFPDSFRRARKNSVDLFPEIVMKPVTGIRQFRNERSLGLQFSDGYTLVFKMHGQQANVVLFHHDVVRSIFRNQLTADHSLRIDSLDREIEWALPGDSKDLQARYFTFGKQVWKYLDENGFQGATQERQREMISGIKTELENPRYCLLDSGGMLRLSLLPCKNPIEVFDDPVKAINGFYYQFVSQSAFNREKSRLQATLASRVSQSVAYLAKAKKRLEVLDEDRHFALWADLIMANLHLIGPGTEGIELEDFHRVGKRVNVPLRRELTPQKNAEVYYRKAKNQTIEKRRLTEAIAAKEKEIAELKSQEHAVLQADRREELLPIAALIQSREKAKEHRSLPYHTYLHGGYTILVGKNAAANDELTLHHAHKEDLWLHARDVSGSHVVIRHQGGKNYPKETVAYAASLAAYHSKRRNDTLCPVSVTPVKYVRKRKGDPPGAVVVQRENVIMAEPWSGGSER